MSYDSLLINTCTTQRFVEGAADDYGKPSINWGDHVIDTPCRLTPSVGREVKVGAMVVVAEYNLFLGDVDVTERDQVIIDEITYEILLVTNRQNGVDDHHKECLLRTVR